MSEVKKIQDFLPVIMLLFIQKKKNIIYRTVPHSCSTLISIMIIINSLELF